MGRITISDLHGYLLDERNSGALTQIPVTLYEEVHAEVLEVTNAAKMADDPFGEGVQSLLKERESLREYIKAIYSERTHKIFSLALAKANGEEINREDVRAMVPGERALFNAVAESAHACRKALLDGKPTDIDTGAFSFVPAEIPVQPLTSVPISSASHDIADEIDARADEVFSKENADAETAPESYRVVMIRDEIDEFQDYSGRVYSLSPGDVVSLPAPMADILCNRNIALNIRLRK